MFIESEERKKHPLFILLLVLFVLSTGIETMDSRLLAMGALVLFGGGAWIYKSPDVNQAQIRLSEVKDFLMKFEEQTSELVPDSDFQSPEAESTAMVKKSKGQSRRERKKSSTE